MRRVRSLLPREHGAYAQFAGSIGSAVAIGDGAPPALLLALAMALVFVAHEPVLVLTGVRGARALVTDGPRAGQRLRVLLISAALAAGTGLWLAPIPATVITSACLVLGMLLVALIRRRAERTLFGELLVALLFSLAAVVVVVAGRIDPVTAAPIGFAWFCVFAGSLLAVRATLARAKRRPRRAAALDVIVAALTAGVALAAAADPTALSALTRVAPLAGLFPATIICALRLPARQLRNIGWSLAVAYAGTAALLIAGA